MERRGDIGSWLEGTPGGDGSGEGPAAGRAGLGLPAAGPGSLAGVGRRVVGILVDWGLASLISYAFFGFDEWATLAVFGISTAVLVATLGTTIGHRVVGVQVVRLGDLTTVLQAASSSRAPAPAPALLPPPGLLLGLVRTVLVCLVIPAVVWDSTGRGLHDVAAGTVLVRR